MRVQSERTFVQVEKLKSSRRRQLGDQHHQQRVRGVAEHEPLHQQRRLEQPEHDEAEAVAQGAGVSRGWSTPETNLAKRSVNIVTSWRQKLVGRRS